MMTLLATLAASGLMGLVGYAIYTLGASQRAFAAAMERVVTVQTIGQPGALPGEVIRSIPDPEERLAREFTAQERLIAESTVQAGMTALEKAYRDAGQQPPNAHDLRKEVELMLNGEAPR